MPVSIARSVRRLLSAAGAITAVVSMAGWLTASSAQTVTVTNVTSNHYHYNYFPGDCPSGWNIPSGQYPTGYHIERPHVIYNASTAQWVLWAHYDDSSYTAAEVLVATSSTECGPYTVQSEFQPNGYQSRDETIFEDDDGSGYLVTASNEFGGANDTMAIMKMTGDYLNIDSSAGTTWVFAQQYREAPQVAKAGGKYFLFTSQAAGWFPSQGGYAVSSAMMSGWPSSVTTLANTSTFGGQPSGIIKVAGTSATTWIMTLDHLGGNSGRDTGSIWLPVILDSTAGTATMNFYTSYSVDMTTGLLTLPTVTNAALGKTVTATETASGYPASNVTDGNYTTRWIATTGCSSGCSSTFPQSVTIDLGSNVPVQEVNLSWAMTKGSEAYYKYQIGYSTDGTTFTTIDRTSNTLYGFTSDDVNFTARYVKITETGFVCQNGCSFYTPSLYEAEVISAPTSSNLPATVTVTPSSSSVGATDPFTVTVSVSGGGSNPVPTGKVVASGPGWTSDVYGLQNGSATFSVPGGALTQGLDTLTATYTADPTSEPVYGLTQATGTATVTVGTIPAVPTGLALNSYAVGQLTATWTASSGATSYVLKRSMNGGAYSTVASPTTTSYTDTGLSSSNNYCYTIAATNSLGTSADSSPVCSNPASVAITIPNYSFESPTTTTYIYNPSGGSWTFSGSSGNGSGVTANNSGFTSGNPAAPDGKQVAFVQQTGSIVQSVSGFVNGGVYNIIFSAAQRANKSGGQAGQTFDVRVNGTTVASFAPPQSATSYSDYSTSFTATGTSQSIGFYGTDLNTGDNTIFLDNVRIVRVK